MPQTLLYDLETTAIGPNGELPDRVHLCIIHDYEANKRHEFHEADMDRAVRMLEEADISVAHNLIGFDGRVITELFDFKPKGIALDSLVLCEMFEGDIKERVDFDRFAYDQKNTKPTDPLYFRGDLIGAQSIEAWGMRLGRPKEQYTAYMKKKGLDPWAALNDAMIKYGHGDVDILVQLWDEHLVQHVQNPKLLDAIVCEHTIAQYMIDLEVAGTCFDIPAAEKLYAELQEHTPKILSDLQEAFPPILEPVRWISTDYKGNQKPGEKNYVSWENNYRMSCQPYERYYTKMPEEMGAVMVPKRTMWSPQDQCYRTKHSAYCKIKQVKLKPTSRPQLTRRLKRLGWEPEKFTDAGNPQLDEDVLEAVGKKIPEAKDIARLYLLNKRISQLATGPEAWLKKVAPDGKIHPRIKPCATITHRPTHSKPNMSQVPAVQFKKVEGSDQPIIALGEEGGWGYECRSLFIAPYPGLPITPPVKTTWKQVGVDLSGLELRCLAHYLREFDGGEFGHRLLNEDVHEYNRQALEVPNRTDAKSFLFACIYGAGNQKLGGMIYPDKKEAYQQAQGKKLRAKLMKGIKGMSSLNHKYGLEADRQERVKIIDGRYIPVRNSFSVLNTLLQSTGAVLAKYWIKEAMRAIQEDLCLEQGYDKDFQLTGFFHDELAFVCKEEYADDIMHIVIASSLVAGRDLKFSLLLESEGLIGNNWGQTH